METHGMAILRVVNIFYNPEENRFYTEDGQVIINMNPLVSPNTRYIFRSMKKNMSYVIPHYNLKINLYYPKGG